MADLELELRRAEDDRRVFVLGAIGTMRLTGFLSRAAIAEADGTIWRLERRGFWQRGVRALADTGVVVGEFEPRTVRRGGVLRWHGREFVLRPASSWRERYSLVQADRELALFDGKGWGQRPLRVSVSEGIPIEPGLLLFTAFVVRGLVEDANTASAAGASTAATG